MVFSNVVFLFIFLPLVLLGYFILRGRARNYWLLLVSLFFYGWSIPAFLPIILVSILLNYLGGLGISLVKTKGWKKAIMIGTVALNLAMLFYYKYFNFTMDIISRVLSREITYTAVVLPIGISFFTFQGLAYVVDVYRGEIQGQRNIAKVGLQISLFPQLIAGPIVRYKDVAAEIDQRSTSVQDFADGVQRFIIGLFKKVIIADTLAVAANKIFGTIGANTAGVAWLGAIAYSFQLFFDFAGYSDMAIGLGRIFGFHFLENFNYPYISRSITEFWRRWHISLSSFFRDYVYIPLGGNRKRVYLNVSIVFLLTGIWHGAAFTFILWGIWHGIFNIAERIIRQAGKNRPQKEKPKWLQLALRVLQHGYTLLVVLIGWVLFRAEGLTDAANYLLSMAGQYQTALPIYKIGYYLNGWTVFALVLAVFMSTPVLKNARDALAQKMPETLFSVLEKLVLLAMLLLVVLQVASGTYSAFIYFQF